ncbi:MAG: DUF6285 domain-containing protein [Chloroflexi bacterium]|nr:DUF6285 domain-containing protein [Chloroflexota bacterium]
MYDKPSLDELLAAVQVHLEENVIPAVKENRKLYFQTLVAINLLKVSQRELDLASGHLQAEWQRITGLLEIDKPFPIHLDAARAQLATFNAALIEKIRNGEFDKNAQDLIHHLKAITIEQLETANPKFLIQGEKNE